MKSIQALIIEDEHDLADAFSTLLESQGLSIEIISDGRKAMEVLAEKTPDMVLLDINLPYISGDEILAHIRATERLKHTKVIIISANIQMANVLSDHADLVLTKPISMSRLLNLSQWVIGTLKMKQKPLKF